MGRTGKYFVVFLSVCLMLVPAYAICQNYRFISFKSEKELEQPYVYSLVQDSEGCLWIGTGKGLSRYDGFVFEKFTVRDSLADNFITCGIRNGNDLWFGHMNGRISYYHNRKFHKVSTEGRELGPVTHFATDPGGNTWFSTYGDGLSMLNPEALTFRTKFFGNGLVIHTFEFLGENRVLVGTGNGLLECSLSESDTLGIIGPAGNIPESKITGIRKLKSRSGYCISTENDGLFLLTMDAGGFHTAEITPAGGKTFTGVQQVIEDYRSDLWLATMGDGLIRLTFKNSGDPEFSSFNKMSGFETDHVRTVFSDREGIIWVGNYGDGLTQVMPVAFSPVVMPPEVYGRNVTAVFAGRSARWIGTEKGLVKKDRNTGHIMKFYSRGNGLPDDNITAIYSANDSVFWIGTGKNGLLCLDDAEGKIIPWLPGESSMENSITHITGRHEKIWIGTQKGLCLLNTTTMEKTWYTINRGGLPHNFINSLYLDTRGILWVSTNSNTLARIENGKVQKIELSAGPGVLTLSDITEDAASRIWVGSFGNGIFMIDKDSVVNIGTRLGLFSNYCYSVTRDDLGNIWIGHRGGISRIRSVDFTVKILQDRQVAGEHCQFNRNAVWQDMQTIFFGSDNGLYSYDRTMEFPPDKPPVLTVTSIRINDKEIDSRIKNLNLAPGNYDLTIAFRGVSLKEPSLVRYQYKLEGLDQWSDITQKNEVTYTHLSKGKYRFILKASDSNGDVTLDPLVINIAIREPVWEKWWFYTLIVLSSLLLIFAYIKWRLHRLTTEKAILEEKVLKRTNEIECQKNELALQRDLIEKKNASITSSILYASQIQNAILPPEDLVDRILPENFILNLPKDIVSGDFYWVGEKDNKIVFTVADCTGHGIPGSFMSLLGITMISEIVNIRGILESDKIVGTLRDNVIESLQQSRKTITTVDGMDMSLCVLDPSEKTIQFTGGMNDLIFIHQGHLQVLEADHISVSVLYADNKFSRQDIRYEKGDLVYLASDGFQDQFGGKRDKKFLRHRLHELFLEIHLLPMRDQKEMLEKRLREWMGSTVQTDDILVMGIRL